MLSIGVVARQTGIEIGTLRKWESRYGFPKPLRRESGHRYYRDTDVENLLLIARRVATGERVGKVIREFNGPAPLPSRVPRLATANSQTAKIIAAAAAALLGDHVTVLGAVLAKALRQRSMPAFVEEVAAPLTHLVGEYWALGKLPIHGEHLYAAILDNLLAQAANRCETAHGQPAVLLTTLAGEQHTLGLSMAHAVLSDAGIASLKFPTGLPIPDIVAAAKAYRVAVVGISVGFHYSPRMLRAAIWHLRADLPAEIGLWLGGSGMNQVCEIPAGARVIASMVQLLEVCQAISLPHLQPLRKARSTS